MNDQIPRAAIETLWEYMRMRMTPRDCDLLIMLGSIDDRVAAVAARLYQQYDYDWVMATRGHVTRNSRQAGWDEPTEAEHFARIFQNSCRPRNEIILEREAQNTGQNATLSHAVLSRAGIPEPKTIMIVTKPYMERRALGTFEAQWPGRADAEFFVHSSGQSVGEYCTPEFPLAETARIMLKDFINSQEYATRGWQTRYGVPRAVKKAALSIEDWLNKSK